MRLVRLNCARRDLLARGLPELATVTEIATKWGFEELGEFAGYYRRAFGERPSETLAMSLRARGFQEVSCIVRTHRLKEG